MKPRKRVWIASLVLAAAPILARADPSAPASPSTTPPPAMHPPAGQGDGTPIGCPLHEQGVNPSSLRPFAETEKYIQFLERPDRARWQKPDDVVRALGLRGDETVEDLGAGSGYFTFRFARALPRGKVIAADIDPEMIRHIHHKVLAEKISNVTVRVAREDDPAVDPGADVVFICDVLHHVSGREAWLRKAYAEMKPGARLVLIEFREGRLPEGPPESVKLPRAKLVSLVEGAGFTLRSDQPALLPYQTFLTFTKPAVTGR